jgi:hypothetical protein
VLPMRPHTTDTSSTSAATPMLISIRHSEERARWRGVNSALDTGAAPERSGSPMVTEAEGVKDVCTPSTAAPEPLEPPLWQCRLHCGG